LVILGHADVCTEQLYGSGMKKAMANWTQTINKDLFSHCPTMNSCDYRESYYSPLLFGPVIWI
jgi:hypothetical protein